MLPAFALASEEEILMTNVESSLYSISSFSALLARSDVEIKNNSSGSSALAGGTPEMTGLM